MNMLPNGRIFYFMDTSFLELRCKEVVNVVDGRKLGHICDVIFNLENGCLGGVVVPGQKSGFFGKGGTELFIPLAQIVKVGQDAVLVEIFGNQNPNSIYISAAPENKKK